MISDYCREKCGVVLGRGIGELQGRAFRIAHMGHVNAPMVFGVLGAIEMALGALGIPHGRGGLQAAVEYLGREVRPSRLLKNPTLGIGPACEFDYDAHDDSDGGAHAR